MPDKEVAGPEPTGVSTKSVHPEEPWGDGPPVPIGEHDAYVIAGTTAAPLLAGFSVTATTTILREPGLAGMPGAALILFSAAVGLLLLTLQATVLLRRYQWSREDIVRWHPATAPKLPPKTETNFELRNKEDRKTWEFWRIVSQSTYMLGLIAFLTAFGFLLIPPEEPGPLDAERVWVAWMPFLIATLVLGWWIFSPLVDYIELRRARRERQPR